MYNITRCIINDTYYVSLVIIIKNKIKNKIKIKIKRCIINDTYYVSLVTWAFCTSNTVLVIATGAIYFMGISWKVVQIRGRMTTERVAKRMIQP